MEYHIGLKLCRHFSLKVNNRTPHASQSGSVYNFVFELIRKHNITCEELILGSVNKIYKRIIIQRSERNGSLKYNRILSKSLPSYLQCFNYKVHNNVLPVNTMFRHYALDNNSCCYFCLVGPESILHIFGTCEKIKILWKIASETVFNITQKPFDFENIRRNLKLDLVCVNLGNFNSQQEKMLVYFNTVLNHAIWKERNDIKFNFKSFRIGNIVNRIVKTLRGRRNIDDKLLEGRRIPFLRDLFATFLQVTRKYFPIDNG